MRKTVYIAVAALVAGFVLPMAARERSRSEILTSAAEVLIKSGDGQRRSPSKDREIKVLDSNEAFTVVGFDGGAYAIVANDDLLPEILGYSASPYEAQSDNPGFAWWCRSIKDAALNVVKSGKAPQRVSPDSNKVAREVPQLLTDIWGQLEPFNNLCPLEYDASGRLVGRTVVGCVATSASQVMRYHQYPPQGEGIHVDTQTTDAHGNVIPIKIDFKDYKFDYSRMKDSYSIGTYTREEGDAVAALCYPVGVSFGMIYGTGASGTFSDSAVYSLKKYLKFPDAKLLNRFENNENTWMNTIFEELDAHRPILYSGADDLFVEGGGGHAFVLDGYDADGLVHVNWGWFGRNNGYYEVALLNPRFHSFKNQQDMIIGVAPPKTGAHMGETLVLSGNVTAEEIAEAVRKSKSDGYAVLDMAGAVLPDGRLPEKAFYSSLFRTIVLPEGLVRIGDGAFGNCRRLDNVVFPSLGSAQEFMVEGDIVYSRDGREVIAVLPYYHNSDLVITDYNSLLRFREGVEILHPHAADGCFRISGVELPATLKKIGTKAFANATNLKVVTVSATIPPSAELLAFSSLDPSYTSLYVPAGYADTYFRAGEWGAFYTFDNVFEFGTTVRARNVVREYGMPNPELGYEVFGGYVTGEPELSCEATAQSPVGEYAIKVGMGSLQGEDILLNDGVLRVVDGEAGIEGVAVSGDALEIYTLDGRKVSGKMKSLDALPRGIYIINGNKVIK